MKHSIITLMVFICVSCNHTENGIIDKFKQEGILFEDFKSAAVKDKTLTSNIGKFTKIEDLEDSTKYHLEKLELYNISYIILSEKECSGKKVNEIEIIFNGNWCLAFSPCEIHRMRTGSHEKKGFIESWRLNESWFLWVNRDVIG